MSDEKLTIQINGRLLRIARLSAEYFESLEAPTEFVKQLRNSRIKADIFTFVQRIPETKPKYVYRMEWDSIAVLPISTYENWWKNQINDKTRNMIRRAQKAGVQIRIAELDDEFVKGIKRIFDESPLIQDKPNRHYGKDLETLRKVHISFIDRRDFAGAYDGDDLIGYMKVVHCEGFSGLMHILSMSSSRNKAPTNALIAKAVEICAQKNIPFLMYGAWSKRGLGDFKKHHAFVKFDLPRFFVPLTVRGKIALWLGFHRKIQDRLPGPWLDYAASLRKKWNSFRYGNRNA